jgi:hypothetical protein
MFLGFDVAMHQPGAVRGRERRQHRLHDRDRFGRREMSSLVEQVPERAPGHQLHDQEDFAAVVALVVHGDGVDVRQPGRHAGLAREAVDEGWIGRTGTTT